MKNNTQFSVGVQILAMAALNPGKHVTSELLARSVNTNPALIRRLTGRLKQEGLIEIRRGVGCVALCRPPEEITLLDVFRVFSPNPESEPFSLHPNPNPKCYIGRNIHDALEMPLAKVNQAMQASLASTTIRDIASFIAVRCGKEANPSNMQPF